MQQKYYVQSYNIFCLAGDGSQGQVYLAKKGQNIYVIKLFINSIKAHDYYLQQVSILSLIKSEYIIKMVQYFQSARTFLGNQQQYRHAIVLQFADHGQLFKIISYLGKLSQDASRTYFYQLIKALKHLKNINITHRDIKLQNILLDKHFNLKLADFGFARQSLGNNNDFILNSWRGTQSYMAPQIHQRSYKGQKVDVFASGVVLFLMFVRIPPFSDTEITNNNYNLIRQGKLNQFWALFQKKIRPFSQSFKQLIQGLFHPISEKRFTLEEILQHQWMKGKILTSQELQSYLKPRYEKLINKDEETRNIRRHLRQSLQKIINQNHHMIGQQRQRSRQYRTQTLQCKNRAQQLQNMIVSILQFDITLKDLPSQFKYNIFYCEIHPKLLLLWVNQILSDFERKKQIFAQSTQKIEFASYVIKFNKNGELQILINLNIISQNDESSSEIKLKGQIINWQQKISIICQGLQGNEFWLYQLIQVLYRQFQLTFS